VSHLSSVTNNNNICGCVAYGLQYAYALYGSAVGAGGGNYLSKFKHAHMLLLLKEPYATYCTAENRVRYGLTAVKRRYVGDS
jgi:hypothetical protein